MKHTPYITTQYPLHHKQLTSLMSDYKNLISEINNSKYDLLFEIEKLITTDDYYIQDFILTLNHGYARKVYLEMLDYLKSINGNVVLVVDNFNRLGRQIDVNSQIAADMISLNVDMETPSDRFINSPEGHAFFNMQSLFSQYQRQSNAKQVNDRMKSRVLNGYRAFGGCALGYETTELTGLHRPYLPPLPRRDSGVGMCSHSLHW